MKVSMVRASLALDVGIQIEILAPHRRSGRRTQTHQSWVIDANAGLASQHIGPGLSDRITHGTDASQTSDNNATTGHRSGFTVCQKPRVGHERRT